MRRPISRRHLLASMAVLPFVACAPAPVPTPVPTAAPLKVNLTASDEERARRRQRDETASARAVDVDEVRRAIARRDALDRGRVVSPLRVADDAITIDTTTRAVDDIVADLVDRARAAGVA